MRKRRGIVTRTHQRRSLHAVVIGLVMIALVTGGLWACGAPARSPRAIHDRAQEADPEQAAQLHQQLAEQLPEIEEYTRLWAAQAALPSLDAVTTLRDIIAFRPQSAAAYEALVTLARYYADLEAPQAEETYREALALHDSVALRLELARHLEDLGDNDGAYLEYHTILGDRPDAFEGMRRTGSNALTVAEDLINAAWFSDALETLRDVDQGRVMALRGRALSGLGRYEEAGEALQSWLEDNPDDDDAKMELAKVLSRLGEMDGALEVYEEVDSLDSQLAQADLLKAEDPDKALELYQQIPYPVAWWSATSLLEAQGQLTETLPLYRRIAQSSTHLADDAAYRLRVLAERLTDEEARAEADALLEELGINWLAVRAREAGFQLPTAPPLAPAGEEILAKVEALEALGRDDLAVLELELSAATRRAPEIDLAMAQALADRGEMVQAHSIAAAHTANDDGRAPLAFWQLSYPRPYPDAVQAASAEFQVDPHLIWSVMRQESRFDAHAMSYVGARGLMQVMPSTQVWIAEQLGEDIAPGEAFTPESNIRMGAWFLRFLLDYFDDDVQLAVAGYNGGAGSVDEWLSDPLVSDRDDLLRWIGFGETREYVERVSMNYEIYEALYQRDESSGSD